MKKITKRELRDVEQYRFEVPQTIDECINEGNWTYAWHQIVAGFHELVGGPIEYRTKWL